MLRKGALGLPTRLNAKMAHENSYGEKKLVKVTALSNNSLLSARR